jgi:hypothetical protein
MARFTYKRDAVPVGETIYLEVQFSDSASNVKDADSTPTIAIIDAASLDVIDTTTQSVVRIGQGKYRYQFIIPDGYTSGIWNDTWTGILDGYSISNTFDFTVDSAGSIEATTTIVEEEVQLGDEPEPEEFTQSEIKNINKLLKTLSDRLRSTAYKPDGTRCDTFATDMLVRFICASLSEFNATPTITGYTFNDQLVVTLFGEVITQGAMLIAWAGQSVIESGNEWTMNDNGVQVNPPPISATITTMYNAQLSDYRAKLKEIKRNLRPGPLGMGAGSILVNNPAVAKLRHRRENQII